MIHIHVQTGATLEVQGYDISGPVDLCLDSASLLRPSGLVTVESGEWIQLASGQSLQLSRFTREETCIVLPFLIVAAILCLFRWLRK